MILGETNALHVTGPMSP